MSLHGQANGSFAIVIMPAVTFTTAVTNVLTSVTFGLEATSYIVADAVFTYGSGGTNVTAYLQTALGPNGAWFDIMAFQFTTSTARKLASVIAASISPPIAGTDASLTVNTVQNGLIGDRLRVKYTSTGTYAGGTTLAITVYTRG